MTEDQAAIVIQKWVKGYLLRNQLIQMKYMIIIVKQLKNIYFKKDF
jgi:hypothetical protein